MTRVAGEQDLWQIKLKPKAYYGMAAGEFPYWLAAVFRNAAGSAKGTAQAGNYDFGLVASNFDYFIKNAGTVGNKDIEIYAGSVIPNPTSGWVSFPGLVGTVQCAVFTLEGKQCLQKEFQADAGLDLTGLQGGEYVLLFSCGGKMYQSKLIFIP